MRSVYGRHIYLNLLCDNAGGGLLNIIDEDPSVSKYNQTTHCDPLVFFSYSLDTYTYTSKIIQKTMGKSLFKVFKELQSVISQAQPLSSIRK